MPLPNTKVFHARWSEHHQPTVTGGMTAECVITRAAATGITGADGSWTPPVRTQIYAGPCRVGMPPRSREALRVSGEDQQTRLRYAVGIRHDTDQIHVGDQIEITAAVDPLLVGLKLRIADARYGSERWQQDLNAFEIEPGQ